MKQLYILPFAACLLASSALAQSQKSPDGLTAADRAFKSIVRTAPLGSGLRGTAPPNDECTGAVSLTVGASCNATTGTLDGATESMPASACSGFTSATAFDVWYSFTATETTTIISVTGGAGTTDPDTTGIDPVLELFTGDCAALTAVGCIDATLPAGTTEAAQATTTVGTTYYYRIYFWAYGGLPTNYEFTTCVYNAPPPPPAPANDDCAGATPLAENAFCLYTGQIVDGATQSLAGVVCNGFTGNANDDVWYSFVASAADMTVGARGFDDGDGNVNTGYDAVIEVFDGCGGTSLGCADGTLSGEAEQVDLTGLTVGNTYFFRVYNYYTAIPAPNGVDVCVVPGAVNIGIEESNGGAAWGVFPNPNDGQFSLSYAGANGTGDIEVIDAAGRVVFTERSAFAAGTVRNIELNNITAGNYTVRLTVNGERSQQRLMVK